MELLIYVDGACRGNPGPAAAACRIEDSRGRLLRERAELLGPTTNNVAEYRALLLALSEARALGGTHLVIRSDSELLIRQLRGEYRVKAKHLQKLAIQARELLNSFPDCRLEEVPRELNRRADALANQALNRGELRPG